MMESRSKKIFATLVLALNLTINFGQSGREEVKYHQWYDQLVGIENAGLYYGIIYKDGYRTINEKTKFFKSPDFLLGSVIYDEQPYYNLDMKYNVFEDELLVRTEDRVGGATLQLFKNKIKEFTIEGHKFLKIEDTSLDINIAGFYEVSLENERFILLTKHKKKDFNRKDRSKLYYEFLDLRKQQVLLYENSYHIIKSKKTIMKLFPGHKKEIDSFYRVARSLRNSDTDKFILALMKRIETLILQENKALTE